MKEQYTFKLKDRFEVAEGTMAFVLDTTSAPDFSFIAGQYMEIGLKKMLYADEKKDHREFSIASSPNDKGMLMIATRMRGSAFKRSLAEMPLGNEVKAEGPHGSFTLHENPNLKAAFIAGGIGITPIRSMVKYAAEEKLPHAITLLYSNRTPEVAPFLDDLQKWAAENPNFRFVPTITDMQSAKKPWNGRTRRIDAAFLKETLGDGGNTIFYVVGPPGMVQGVTEALKEFGASRDDIRFEEFTGY